MGHGWVPWSPGLREVDTLVIGSGFGGLSAALTLAEQGVEVLLVESLKYPGGCASTFTKQGYAFEAGATLLTHAAPDHISCSRKL